jgi:yecA family protein
MLKSMKFDELTAKLGDTRTPTDVSQLHGLISGWLSAGVQGAEMVKSDVFSEWFGEQPLTDEFESLALTLAVDVQENLSDIDLGFQLMIPADVQDINLRQRCISHWCAGFLSGFGMTGRFQQSELEEEVSEVFTDLARIASLDEDVPDSDENEDDLIEITEYVRMAALLVFTECAGRRVH